MYSFRDYISFSEKFHLEAEEAKESENLNKSARCAMASLLFSWISIETFVNNMLDDFSTLPDFFQLHERALLEEKEVEFITSGANAGTFNLSNRASFKRLEDKIMFLVSKVNDGETLNKGDALWHSFNQFKEKRNYLTHPKKQVEFEISIDDSKKSNETAKAIISYLGLKVWKTKIEF
jgi:hypothetical protein